MKSSHPRSIVALLLLAVLITSSGCLTTTNLAPRPIRFAEKNQEFEDKFSELKKTYEAAMQPGGNADSGRVARDRLIFLLRVEIDKWYAQLELELHETRAKFNSWSDFLELGLSGAGAIASPVDSKTIYATLVSVSKGTRLSIDKNWFREKATESLMNAMRTGRSLQLAQIVKKMTASSANAYTFEEAWGDLIAYHQAGTIQGGLVLLAATTGEKAKEAEAKVDNANFSRYPVLASATPAMIEETINVGDKGMALPPEKKRAVLTELKIAIPDGAAEEKLTELMNTLIQSLAPATAEQRKKIIEAINKQ
ncbi:MAG: hypothetical protein Q8N18_16400 [Opitutaceae bacterium]|nr:hypothetical protein [Opitutaceae bacterium]